METTKTPKRNKTRALAEGAAMIALAQILSYLIIYRLPYGGSVDAAMLPIVVFALRWGCGWGGLVGFVFGLLQYFLGNGLAISWLSLLGDYAVAFAVLGVAGLFRGKKYGLLFGCLLASLARFLVHWAVGATVWAAYMPETFWNMKMTSTWVYSALYNISYMGPDCLIITVIAAVFLKAMPKYMRGEDIL